MKGGIGLNILLISRGNGFGHARRDMLLARALQRAGHEVTMASYASALALLKNFYDGRLIDLGLPAFGNEAERVRKLLDLFRDVAPELVVSDEELLALPIAVSQGIPVCFVTNWLDDNREMLGYLRMADSIAVVDMEDHWLFPIPDAIREKIRFVGPVLDISPIERNPSDQIVVTAGSPTIADARFFAKAIQALKPDRRYRKLIYGGTLTRSLERLKDDSVRFVLDQTTFLNEAASSRLVICRGGHTTLWELAALGIPGIAIPRPADVNPYNAVYARQMAARNYIEWLDESELTEETLALKVESALGRPFASYRHTGESLERLLEAVLDLSPSIAQ